MSTTNLHWHTGHNVSGYTPESDVSAHSSWDDARSVLSSDLEYARDNEADYREDPSQEYLDELDAAMAALASASPNQEFLAYTATHPESAYDADYRSSDNRHDIPTAWWINSCYESECKLDDND